MGSSEIDWSNVKRILVVKLRSIGDSVLATPSLIALRRFVPNAQIDILLEDWVAPLLEGHDAINNVISVGKNAGERLKIALQLRRQKYDIAFNLHGGTTATFFTAASRAKHRVGFADYQYSFLYNHLLSSASDFWQTEFTHSAEQQLALLGFVGVPVEDRPKSRLCISSEARNKVNARLTNSVPSVRSMVGALEPVTIDRTEHDRERPLALVHPASAFFTKQWPAENFARTAEFLAEKGINIVAIAAKNETAILEELKKLSRVPITTFNDLSLPEIMVLASQAKIFVGNDSGIAHIAAAVGTPSIVVFGSSNRNHWRPWTDAPNEIVYEEFACQPCPGYECKEFGVPRCILTVSTKNVFNAIVIILSANKSGRMSTPTSEDRDLC